MNGLPWSHSSLTSFETCAWKHYLTKVKKEVSDPPGEAAKWGTTVHKYLEDHVKTGEPLHEDVKYLSSMVEKITSSKGEKIAEQQLAITPGYAATDWWDKGAWARAIIDVTVINGSKAVTLDYKTGKRKVDSDQLKMSSALLFAHYPDLTKITTGFLWLKDGKMDTAVFHREQIGEIWASFLPRVRRLELAFENDKWPKKPSGLCRQYCPVGKNRCEFCGD
jgi:hypothetical protein